MVRSHFKHPLVRKLALQHMVVRVIKVINRIPPEPVSDAQSILERMEGTDAQCTVG